MLISRRGLLERVTLRPVGPPADALRSSSKFIMGPAKFRVPLQFLANATGFSELVDELLELCTYVRVIDY